MATYEGRIDQLQHGIEYWYELGRSKLTETMKARLDKEAKSRSKEMIIQGYHSGELNCLWKNKEIRGWWKII